MIAAEPQATYAVKEAEKDDGAMLDVLRAAIKLIQESERETVIDDVPLAARQARREAHKAINSLANAAAYWRETHNRTGATPGEKHSALVSVGKARQTACEKVAEWYRAETVVRRRIVQPFVDLLLGGAV